MNKSVLKIVAAVVALVLAWFGTRWFVDHHRPAGHVDVIAAQAMDMTQLRPPEGNVPVDLAVVRTGTSGRTIVYTGTVLPYNEQDISSRITGTILSLPVYPGDSVKPGQLLVQLDSEELAARAQEANQTALGAGAGADAADITHRLSHPASVAASDAQISGAIQEAAAARADIQTAAQQVSQDKAAVASAKASADYWHSEIVREKSLYDAGAASLQEYQSEQSQQRAADSAVAAAASKVAGSAAALQSARIKAVQMLSTVSAAKAAQRMAVADLLVGDANARQQSYGAGASRAAAKAAAVGVGYAHIRSPFAGVVVERPVSPGSLVQPGTVILRLSQIDRVRVQASVAVADLATIHVGTPVSISITGAGQSINARVTSVFPAADITTRTAIVEAIVPNLNRRLLPGQYAAMRFQAGGSGRSLLVPSTSVVTEGGRSWVWTTHSGASSASGMYECQTCHMRYSAAQASKYHYVDPMDGGTLLAVPGSGTSSGTEGMTAHKIFVTPTQTGGDLVSVVSPELKPGDTVVKAPPLSISEGAALGSMSQMGSTSASTAPTRYKCEKCGMIYSAADAKKHNYIDPMDGGKLDPVTGGAQ